MMAFLHHLVRIFSVFEERFDRFRNYIFLAIPGVPV